MWGLNAQLSTPPHLPILNVWANAHIMKGEYDTLEVRA